MVLIKSKTQDILNGVILRSNMNTIELRKNEDDDRYLNVYLNNNVILLGHDNKQEASEYALRLFESLKGSTQFIDKTLSVHVSCKKIILD